MSITSSRVEQVTGRAIAVHGDELDTDRIIPARFLKTITFEGLGSHVFEDDRRQAAGRGIVHPFDQPAHQGARILLVQANFGCGSSREHAPQAITRWGIGAIIGISFAEIFFGNSLMIGLPCATASPEHIAALMTIAEAHPDLEFTLDLATSTVSAGDVTLPVVFPDAVRAALRSGDWDATAFLVDRYEEVERTTARLPYISGWDRLRA